MMAVMRMVEMLMMVVVMTKNYASHHSDVVEHEISTTLLLRGQFVAVIKCVTAIRVGNQLSLECFVGMWGLGRLSGLRFGICRFGNDIGVLCSIMASGDI